MSEQCCVLLPGKMPLQRLWPDPAVDVGCSFQCLCTGFWALEVAGLVLLSGPQPALANLSWPPQWLQRLVLTPLLIQSLCSRASPHSLIYYGLVPCVLLVLCGKWQMQGCFQRWGKLRVVTHCNPGSESPLYRCLNSNSRFSCWF